MKRNYAQYSEADARFHRERENEHPVDSAEFP